MWSDRRGDCQAAGLERGKSRKSLGRDDRPGSELELKENNQPKAERVLVDWIRK